MILTAATALAGIASSIYGGIKKRDAEKSQEALINKQQQENTSLFNKEYYADYTKRSDVKSLLSTIRNRLRERSEAAKNTAAVMGSTPEAGVAQQKADNEVYGSAANQIAANASAHKDNVMNRYMQQKNMLTNQQSAGIQSRVNNWSTFMQNGMNTALNSIGSISNNNNGNNN